MKLSILCDAAAIYCPPMEGDREITAIVSRSQDVVKGCLFVCIKGFHTDSHGLIAEVIAAGASCVLTEEGATFEKGLSALYLSTPSTRRAFSFLCHAWFGFPARRLKLIGVTGTNGKTTVTHMLRFLLEAQGCRCGIIGTVGCESMGRCLDGRGNNPLANMTTPDPEELYRILAEMVRDGVEYVIMEVTSHSLVLEKTAPIFFEAAIFTNLTPDHLDFHGSMDAYAEAKAMLFAKSKLSIINLDSPWASRMIFGTAGRLVTCSAERKNADYAAEEINLHSQNGASYRLRTKTQEIPLHCPVSGGFTVINSMQAVICALELGMNPQGVIEALAAMAGVKGRMEPVELGESAAFKVLIDYAHTPDALENLLRSARQMQKGKGRVVLVFGCGGDRDRSKRPMMGRLASMLADFTVVTADNSRSEEPLVIIKEILEGMQRSSSFAVIPKREDAIEFAVMNAREGDLILLAGKGHEEYEITREGRRPFCERKIVQDAYARRFEERNTTDGTESAL